ncbi:MAG TPA: CAP domain-containing protein [Mycobacteriales bacterium]|nr:CAP domain-containing protein [Mycobacteriales bacterium]
MSLWTRLCPSWPGLRRRVAPLAATAMLTMGLTTMASLAQPTAAFASTASMESQFIADMNSARQANGLRPYAVAYDLTSVARQHSQQMAARQSLYHNPSLTSDVHNWRAVGENVGEGPTVQDIHEAFMHSPEHRANILDHDFTQVGVGVSVDKHGTIWVTEDFRQPMSSGGSTSGTAAPHHSSTPHATSGGSTSGGSGLANRVSTVTAAPTTGPSTATPAAGSSPRAVLMHRLRELRRHPHPAGADPVVQAFGYVTALSRLAG